MNGNIGSTLRDPPNQHRILRVNIRPLALHHPGMRASKYRIRLSSYRRSKPWDCLFLQAVCYETAHVF